MVESSTVNLYLFVGGFAKLKSIHSVKVDLADVGFYFNFG